MSLESFVEKLKATAAAYAQGKTLTEQGEYCLDMLNYLQADPQTSPALQHAQLLVLLRYLTNYDKDFMRDSGLTKEIFAYQPIHDKTPKEFINPDDPTKIKAIKAIDFVGQYYMDLAISSPTDNFRELIGKLNLIGFNSEFNQITLSPDDKRIADLLRNFTFDVNNAEAFQQQQTIKDLTDIFKDSPHSSYIPLVTEALNGFKPFNDARLAKLPDNNDAPIANPLTHQLGNLAEVIRKRNLSIPKQDPNNLKYKEIEKFSTGAELKKEEASGLFSHAVNKVQKINTSGAVKNKFAKWWYSKIAPDKLTAMREVMAQEFYRFIMPEQQKTRLAKDKEGNYYVLSEELPGTRPFETEGDIKNKLENGLVRGLGALLIVNLVMNETDAKPGNMLIRPDGQLVKIDGDWCVSALRDPLKFKKGSDITARDIASLPVVSDYKAHNWLDVQFGGKLNSLYALGDYRLTTFDGDFPQNAAFRKEVNETALKILIMPPEMIVKFFASYTNDQKEVGLMSNEIINRVTQLRTAMLQNKSFLAFMDSKAAVDVYVKAHEEILDFKTTKKNVLLTREPKDAMVLMQGFSNLKKQAAQAIANMAKVTPPLPVTNTAAVTATPPPIPANAAAPKMGPPPLPADYLARVKAVPPALPANYVAQANQAAPVRIGPPPIPAGYVAQAKAVPPPLPPRPNKVALPAKEPAPPPLLSEMVKNQGVKSKLQFFGKIHENKSKTPVIEPASPAKKSGVR